MLAILIWAPCLVGLSYLIGQQIIDYFYVYQDYAVWIFLALLLIIFAGLKVLIPMATKRGRRNMRVKIEKLKRRFVEKG
jgi:membrane protein DedA with SNARE-associated domain